MEISFKIKNRDDDARLWVKPLEDLEFLRGDVPFSLVEKRYGGSGHDSDQETEYFRITLMPDNHFRIDYQHPDIAESEAEVNDKLDQLAIAIITAVQQGEDLSEASLDDYITTERPYDAEKIRVDAKTFSLRQISDMMEDGDLDVMPDFQRNIVWDATRKSRLIESILLRIPLPTFYFSQTNSGLLQVVDGLQRLTAIREFMTDRLPLTGLEYLKECTGKTYSTLRKESDKLYRRFNMTQISANIIDPQSPVKVKYDIFRRLNTGGRPLNSQELRNCLASNPMRAALRDMAHSEAFISATGGSVPDNRMAAQELALRYIMFRRLLNETGDIAKYSGNMDDDLDNEVELLSTKRREEFDDYIATFRNAMINARYLFGRHAFRKVSIGTGPDSGRSIINKALFISWALVLGSCPVEFIRSKFRPEEMIGILGQEIDKDSEYRYYLSVGTNGRNNIIYAFDKAGDILGTEISKR